MDPSNAITLALPPDPKSAAAPSAKSIAPSQKLTPVQETKLRKAAADFESIMLSTFWKSMKDSFGGDDDDSLDPAHDTLENMGMQAMSTAVGKAGGLGLGKLILKHIAPDVPLHPGAHLQETTKPLAASADNKG